MSIEKLKQIEMSEIKYAKSDAEIESCWEVVQVLRPHLKKENFLPQVQEMMLDGYQMIFIAEGDAVAAFAGFRNMNMLYGGKIIYIDDVSTLPRYRGKGYASLLLDFIHKLAKKTGMNAVHLDSGYHRNDAHRLYLNKGYKIASHHFEREVEGNSR